MWIPFENTFLFLNTAPDPVSGLLALTRPSTRNVVLSWRVPDETGGGPLERILVRVHATPSPSATICTFDLDSLSLQVEISFGSSPPAEHACSTLSAASVVYFSIRSRNSYHLLSAPSLVSIHFPPFASMSEFKHFFASFFYSLSPLSFFTVVGFIVPNLEEES